MFHLPKWSEFHDAVYEEDDDDFEDELSQYFGSMLTSLMLELRDDGSLSTLPLTKSAFMIIEEFDGHYF